MRLMFASVTETAITRNVFKYWVTLNRPDMTLDVYRGRKTTMQQQWVTLN